MKNAITLLILVVILTSTCKKEDTPPEILATPGQIEYFGFAMIDVGWDDPFDSPSTQKNYLEEVAHFSNIADILVENPLDNIKDRLLDMNSNNVKAYVRIQNIFFEETGINAPSGTQYTLRADYEMRWTFFISNTYLLYGGLIQAFYLSEAPTWNGISFEELKVAADYIKSTTPDVPIMIIEPSASLDQLQIPTTVDWVGFKRYFIKDPKNDPGFQSDLALLKTKLSTDWQKLVFIMDTHHIESMHSDIAGIAIEDMTEVATNYYELALDEPKTIAIIGYFWPGGFEDNNAIGARQMLAETIDEYSRIGKEITGKD
jgi:hypothetical protein